MTPTVCKHCCIVTIPIPCPEMERPLLDDGVLLMRMAASAVAHVTMSLLDDEDFDVEDARVAHVVGWRWG